MTSALESQWSVRGQWAASLLPALVLAAAACVTNQPKINIGSWQGVEKAELRLIRPARPYVVLAPLRGSVWVQVQVRLEDHQGVYLCPQFTFDYGDGSVSSEESCYPSHLDSFSPRLRMHEYRQSGKFNLVVTARETGRSTLTAREVVWIRSPGDEDPDDNYPPN